MYSSMADDLIMGYFLLLLCLIVVNDYTQSYDSGKGRKLAYEALRKVFRKIKQNFSGLRIAYQAIDAGLGYLSNVGQDGRNFQNGCHLHC